MIAEVSVGAAWSLVAAAALMRFGFGARPAPEPARRRPLTPVEIALLRGGRRAAMRTALVELHLAGAVEATWPGAVRRVDTAAPRGGSGLARAQYNVLFGHMHPRRLWGIERVGRAVAPEAREAERTGLLLTRRRVVAVRVVLLPALCAAVVGAAVEGADAPWRLLALLAGGCALVLGALPRRTRKGAALLARLRGERIGVRRATVRAPAELLLNVALFGAPVLREQLPRFTEESGLLTRPPKEPMDRGGGSSCGVATCGG
ncbi:TIGR04222 domain-containing membrane protein [Streptomyces sp. NPDC059917]|uniref:TIGR04222 domain-containing membrane protein n=1 Tax=Streptomyces sp. NPDC059917 TaxID=3347002 RepID=UPI0036651296